MKHITFNTKGTCARVIDFDLDEQNKIRNLVFTGGCNGNLKAISKLCEGADALNISLILKGNTCGPRSTSCADQLSQAIAQALENE